MQEKEIWSDIKGYKGLYMVSSFGRVKSMPKRWRCGKVGHMGIYMKPCVNSQGYCLVSLTKKGVHKTKMIHSLVANHFILNTHQKPFINHKNGVKTDNHISNLEWCTQSENAQHAYDTGLQIAPMLGKFDGQHGAAKIVLDLETGIFYNSRNEAAKAKGVNKNTLSHMLIGTRKNKTSLIYV